MQNNQEFLDKLAIAERKVKVAKKGLKYIMNMSFNAQESKTYAKALLAVMRKVRR